MRFRKLFASLTLAAALLLLAGCGKSHDQIDATEALPATLFVLSGWHPGNGFIVDQKERLLLTSQRVAGTQEDIDVLFPVIDNGRALVKKANLLAKGTRVKAKLLSADTARDVAVLQLPSLPEGAAELKLAEKSPGKDTAVHLLGAAAKNTHVWAPTDATVQNIGPKQFSYDGQKMNAQMLELNADGKAAREVSGGPVLNEKNEVVGLIAGDPAQSGPLMCIDVNEVRAALAGAYRNLAKKACDKSEYTRAIALCDKSLSLNEHDAFAFNERGRTYSNQDKFSEAVLDYGKAIAIDPKQAVFYRNRGSAYYHLGKYKEAVEDCSKAIDLMSTYLSAYEIRRDAYEKLHDNKKAEEDARIVATLKKPNWKLKSVTGEAPSGSAK